MRSNIASEVEQGHLMLSRQPPQIDVPLEVIMQRKTLLGAINLCIDLSGLEAKEVCIPLNIDPGHFANLRKGVGHFPPDKINDLMDLCGNEVPLVWQNTKRGYGMVLLKSEAERRAEEAESRAAEAEKKLAWALEVLNGSGA